MPSIASKLTGDQLFHRYTDGPTGKQPSGEFVVIKGGHALALEIGHGIHTETGAVITNVSDEELAVLQADETFKAQVKGGWFIVHDGELNTETDGEKVIHDMNPDRDGSAQFVDSDFPDPDADDANPAVVKVSGRGRKAK